MLNASSEGDDNVPFSYYHRTDDLHNYAHGTTRSSIQPPHALMNNMSKQPLVQQQYQQGVQHIQQPFAHSVQPHFYGQFPQYTTPAFPTASTMAPPMYFYQQSMPTVSSADYSTQQVTVSPVIAPSSSIASATAYTTAPQTSQGQFKAPPTPAAHAGYYGSPSTVQEPRMPIFSPGQQHLHQHETSERGNNSNGILEKSNTNGMAFSSSYNVGTRFSGQFPTPVPEASLSSERYAMYHQQPYENGTKRPLESIGAYTEGFSSDQSKRAVGLLGMPFAMEGNTPYRTPFLPGPTVPLRVPEPPLATAEPNNPSALLGENVERPKKKSKYSTEQDNLILSLKKEGKSWSEISDAAQCGNSIAARNRYQVLMGQQGGGAVVWEKEDSAKLKSLLEEGERTKWQFIANDLSRMRNKKVSSEACRRKIKELFKENPASFGIVMNAPVAMAAIAATDHSGTGAEQLPLGMSMVAMPAAAVESSGGLSQYQPHFMGNPMVGSGGYARR